MYWKNACIRKLYTVSYHCTLHCMYNLDLGAMYKLENKNDKNIVELVELFYDTNLSNFHSTSYEQTWKICEILMEKSTNQNRNGI